MKPERWQQVEKIYNSVLELEPRQREKFLNEACAGDESLRKEVESLFACQAEAEGFIESPAMEVAAKALAEDRSAEPSANPPRGTPARPADSGRLRTTPDGSAPVKPHKRAPWWMYVLGVAFLICAAVRYYALFVAPEYAGINFKESQDERGLVSEVLIRAVLPDSAAARAGLQPGDIILAPNSGGFISSQPGLTRLYWQFGHTYRMEIKRKEERKTVFLTLSQHQWSSWLKGPYRTIPVILLVAALDLILAAIIAFTRPYDPVARSGALFLAIAGISTLYKCSYPMDYPVGWGATLLTFPPMIGWLTVPLQYCLDAIYACIGITFAAVFPRRLFQRRWVWALVWLPAVIAIPHQISVAPPDVYNSQMVARLVHASDQGSSLCRLVRYSGGPDIELPASPGP